jgi:hypothetical protein
MLCLNSPIHITKQRQKTENRTKHVDKETLLKHFNGSLSLVSGVDIQPMAAVGKEDWVSEFGKEGTTTEHHERDLGQGLVK